jgi:type 2 lantibiotic biosynthesis protein LanM
MSKQSFSAPVKAFASQERSRLNDFLMAHPGLDAAERDVILRAGTASLLSEANSSLLRVLLLELHAAKLTGQIPQGPSDTQFTAFVSAALQPAFARHLDDRYPVLRIRLDRALANRRLAIETMVSRLTTDRECLARFFGISCVRLEALSLGLGDSHDQGHAVAKLEFSEGALMYKPRPMQLDVRLDAFLERLFPAGSGRIRVPKAMDRTDYGWTAFVEHEYCESEACLVDFYQNLGRWISVMHLLAGSDIHCENLIASGSVPVIVDPECLFAKNWVAKDMGKGEAYVEATRMISGSVLRSGIVPFRSPFDALKGVELSSMAASAEKESEVFGPTLVDEGTSNARIAEGRITLDGPKSMPSPKNIFLQHVDDVFDGFAQTNHLLRGLDSSGELGPLLQGFRGCRVRELYRPTQVYAEVRQMLWHPASLHDPEKARSRAVAMLGRGVGLTAEQVESEIEDLIMRDVPVYRSGLSDNRIELALGLWRSNALDAQEMILRASILTADLNNRDDGARKKQQRRILGMASASINGDLDKNRRMLAEQAVRRLVNFSVRAGDGSSTWVGPVRGINGWMVEPVEADLYNGLGGIAFTLAGYRHEMGCGRVNTVDDVEETLDGCLTALRSMELASKPMRGGGFNGIGARIWTWLTLHSFMRRTDMLDVAVEHAQKLLSHDFVEGGELDLLSGEAGLIVPLLHLGHATQDPRWLNLAAAIGNRLADAAILDDMGARWGSISFKESLGGFAHGATGIGWSLARLSLSQAGTVENRCRWARVAERAFEFETSLYDKEQCAWRDLRRTDDKVFSNAWCHGGIGIGLAASDLYAQTGLKTHLRTMHAAMASALKLGWHKRVNLCHGSLGMREMVSRIAPVDPEAGRQALEKGDRIVLSEIKRLMTGTDQLVEELFVPGLMTGLSGVVHGLCRMHPKCELPSPLLMEEAIFA